MLPPLQPLPFEWRRDLLRLVALAVLARLFVLSVFAARGLTFPFVDAGGYVAQATWLLEHGNLSIPEPCGARYFHGVPLLLAFLGRFTGHLAVVGVGLNLLFVAGATVLFYRHFPRPDWTAWHALLLPAWLAMSSTVHSEGALWCLGLLGMLALRLPAGDRRRGLLLVVAGYTMVCRPTAFFILLPAFMVAWWRPSLRDWPRLLGEGVLLGCFPVLMAVWSWLETGEVFVQSRWQATEFVYWAGHWGSVFPSAVFTWPGHSFAAMLRAEAVPSAIKLLNVLHLLFYLGALVAVARAWWRDRADAIALWLLLSLLINGAFILTIGGPFGGTTFYRFLAVQANAFVLLAWFRHSPVPRQVWWLACAASLVLAGMIARSA